VRQVPSRQFPARGVGLEQGLHDTQEGRAAHHMRPVSSAATAVMSMERTLVVADHGDGTHRY